MSCSGRPRVMQYSSRRPEALYRSNSSLELEHHPSSGAGTGGGGASLVTGVTAAVAGANSSELRREYGSHGSIDVMGSSTAPAESFFAMLQDYRPSALAVTDQRSPGPAEYLRGKVAAAPATENASNSLVEEGSLSTSVAATSPKLRLKLHRFWGGPATSGNSKPPRHQTDDGIPSLNGCMSLGVEVLEERGRRRGFSHYDCQSLSASLGGAARRRGLLLARRRNTATGASAASMLGSTRSATPEAGDSGDEDTGDGRGNDLIESCPFFRNEVGGEGERAVSLARSPPTQRRPRHQLHRPALACGVSVLEFQPGDTHWQPGACPHQRQTARAIETIDRGANYYRNYFHGQEHQNWFGLDEQLGPVAISIKRERLDGNTNGNAGQTHQYRLLIRTSELLTLRGSVLEDAIPNLKISNSNKGSNTKELLEYVAPEVQLSCLRLGIASSQTEDQLLKLDEQGLTSHYKVGVLYCRAGQNTEEEMYNNEESGPALLEFLDAIGQRVRLKGFDKYRAGLDNKTDSTGLYSVYSQYQDCEIMFHVSTLLPFTPNNRQQLLRKRHIGNDIVTIVFQEAGAQPFTPKNIRSQFQHVFIVVRAIDPCTENTRYSIAVSRSKEVPVFGPPIHDGAVFPKNKVFAEFLLAKIINAENAAHRSEKFATMATRTRQEYLKDLATNYVTATLVETGQKFSMFSSKKKERVRPRPVTALVAPLQHGASAWQVALHDSGAGGTLVDCQLGVSTDTMVLVEEATGDLVFVAPVKSVLGWLLHGSCLRIYHHQGECVTVQCVDSAEVASRLRAVTPGSAARELTLRRNPMGQLGFHVQPDGVVTQVENMGQAWQAGLTQGDRLVEICKVAVCTLSHDQMVDLLKTSATVTATVIAPSPDGTPKRGCVGSCWRAGSTEGDYENVAAPTQAAQQVQPLRRTARSFSPSGSSGYGSGGRVQPVADGTPTSSSSGHSSSDDPWYEALDGGEVKPVESPPPPLPARVHAASSFTPRVQDLKLGAQDFKLGDKVTCLRVTRAANSMPPPECVARALGVSDGHSTDTSSASERHYGVPSEDELSAGSSNVSPRLRRNAKTTPGPGSRGASPRDTGEARLRPGVTPRSAHRASASLSASTLQEDLMRLINPDYMPVSPVQDSTNHTTEALGKVRSSGTSRENLPASEPAATERGEVILTMARPATVISNASTGSSPAPMDRLSPRVNKCPIPLPDAGDMDWPSLVDTATRAMLHDTRQDWADDVVDRLSLDNSVNGTRPADVRGHMAQLESRVARETRRRLSLEDEVRRLRDENRRLQEESQAAAQQLRRFTEWFFQTIDRQQ